jgi:hypothetical protein
MSVGVSLQGLSSREMRRPPWRESAAVFLTGANTGGAAMFLTTAD